MSCTSHKQPAVGGIDLSEQGGSDAIETKEVPAPPERGDQLRRVVYLPS
jgi:hypothetical protein